ncbi:MAG: hypothetical protein WAK01_01210 [Methylocystis sp.]
MTKKRLFGAAGFAALLLGASSAQADIVAVTYAGTVVSGFDQTGLFGPANGNLAGDSYKVVYLFNTSLGQTTSSPTENSASGGTSFPAPTPSIKTTVTINGVSISSNLNGYFDQIYGYNDGSSSQQYSYTQYYNQGATNTVNNYASNFVNTTNLTIPASITTPFSYNVQPGDSQSATVSFSTTVNATGALLVNTFATANITNVSAPGPVPGAGLAGMAALALAGLFVRTRRA